jgi:hypothetical protein
MLTETLDKLIKEEVNKGIEEFKGNYNFIKSELNKYKDLYSQEARQVNELRKIKRQLDQFKIFQSLINNDNIQEIITYFNLKSRKIDFNGMDTERIPVWFKLLCTYYDDKETLFTIMDMFNIEYPYWAKQFKMPYDYNEAELDLIFEHLFKMYVCNSEIFSRNMGFFYTYQSKHKGDIKSLFRESYVEIPWNLLLQNPLLTTEKYFNKIIESLEKKRSRSEYFYMIQDYQDLTDEQVDRMAEYLPTDKLYDYHRFFLDKNGRILKKRIDLAKKYKSKMTDYERSVFYYLNFPIEMQKEFVLNESDRFNGYGINLVRQMEIPIEEKLELLNQINLRVLTKKDEN